MYWIVDVIFVLLLILMLIIGIKKGFSGTVGSLLGAILSIGIGLGGAFLLVWFPFKKWGWVDTLGDSLYRMLGLDSFSFGAAVGNYIAMAILGLITFVICYIIGILLIKLISRFIDWCRNWIVVKIVDGFLGCVVTLSLAVGVIGIIMGVVHMFPNVFPLTYETFQAAELSKILFKLVGNLLKAFGL